MGHIITGRNNIQHRDSWGFSKGSLLLLALLLIGGAFVGTASATYRSEFYAVNNSYVGNGSHVVYLVGTNGIGTIGYTSNTPSSTNKLFVKINAWTTQDLQASIFKSLIVWDTSKFNGDYHTGEFKSGCVTIRVQTKYSQQGDVDLSLVDSEMTDSYWANVSDFQRTNKVRQAADLKFGNIVTTNNMSFILNAAGLGNISRNNRTVFMLTPSSDVNQTNVTWSSSGETGYRVYDIGSGAATIPTLKVDAAYAPPTSYVVVISGTNVIGAYPNNTIIAQGVAGTDDSDVINMTIQNATDNADIYFDGAFTMQSRVLIEKKVNLYNFIGGTATFDCSGLPDGNQAFLIEPVYSGANIYIGPYNLVANALPGESTITVDDASTTLPGSLIIVYDGTTYFSTTYNSLRGESHVVRYVNGSVITLTDPIDQGYLVANSSKIRVIPTPISVYMEGLKFTGTDKAANRDAVKLLYGVDSTFKAVDIVDVGRHQLGIWNSYNVTVNHLTASGANYPGEGYGVELTDANSYITIEYSNITNCRHAISADPSGSPRGQGRNITINGDFLTGWTTDNQQVLDAHAMVISITVYNTSIRTAVSGASGMALGAKIANITGNTIWSPSGIAIASRHRVTGRSWFVADNIIPSALDAFYPIAQYNDTWDFFHYTGSSGTYTNNLYLDINESFNPYPYTYIETEALAPKAIFSAVQSIPSVGKKQVAFTDNTTIYSALNVAGFPTSWVWDATNVTGNGTIVNVSASQNPTLTFGAGNYSIALTASNAAGSNTTTTAYWVNVSGSDSSSVPIAAFSANATTVCYGATVAFTDQSTNTSSWAWVFGDGATSTTQNPEHTYNISSGYFTVALTASNGIGSDTETKTNYIEVQASCSGGDTTPSTHPFSAATGSSMITTALGILGLALIGFGAAIVIGAFTTQSTDGLIAGIFTIMLGGAILIISYMFLSPIMNLVA